MIRINANDDMMNAFWKELPLAARQSMMREVFNLRRPSKEMSLFCNTTWIDGSQKFPGIAFAIKKQTSIIVQTTSKTI